MSEMAFRPRRGRRRVDLNVTPLIDVLFLLIIFFTLTSTFKRIGELELELPESSTSVTPEPGEPRTLVAMESGELLLDGRAIALPELARALGAVVAGDPEARITIQAESGVDHGKVVELLDLVRDAGFPGVAIGTHSKPGAASGSPK